MSFKCLEGCDQAKGGEEADRASANAGGSTGVLSRGAGGVGGGSAVLRGNSTASRLHLSIAMGVVSTLALVDRNRWCDTY